MYSRYTVLVAKEHLVADKNYDLGEEVETVHLYGGRGTYVPGSVFICLGEYTNKKAPWWSMWVLTPTGEICVGATSHYLPYFSP